jgi:cytochrome P450
LNNERADDQVLLEKLKKLPARQRAEVEDFVDFLAAKSRKREAFDRLLSIAPALEAAGAGPMTEDEIVSEVKAVRAAGSGRPTTCHRHPQKA